MMGAFVLVDALSALMQGDKDVGVGCRIFLAERLRYILALPNPYQIVRTALSLLTHHILSAPYPDQNLDTSNMD